MWLAVVLVSYTSRHLPEAWTVGLQQLSRASAGLGSVGDCSGREESHHARERRKRR